MPGLAGFFLLILTFFGFIKSVGAAARQARNEGVNNEGAAMAGLAIGGGTLIYVYLATACLIYALPGFLYSLARMTTKYNGCPFCEAPNMVPVDSPRGRQLLKQVDYAAESTAGEAAACQMPVSAMNSAAVSASPSMERARRRASSPLRMFVMSLLGAIVAGAIFFCFLKYDEQHARWLLDVIRRIIWARGA